MYTLIIIGYIALLAYIALSAKKVSNTKDYLVGGQNLTTWQVASSITADVMGPSVIIFLFGLVLLFGTAGVGLYIVFFITNFLMGYIAYSYHKKNKASSKEGGVILTLSDFYKKQFGIKTEKLYAIISVLFAIGSIIAVYSLNLTVFKHFMKVDTVLATIISFGITISYVLFGGFRMLIKTDIIQLIIMLVLFLFIALTIPTQIPYGEIFTPSSWFAGAFWMFAPVLLFQNLAKPATWQPILGAKDAETAKKGFFYATGLFMVMVIPVIFAAFAIKGLYPELGGMDALLHTVTNLYPSYIAPMVFIGLMAAFMSTVDTLMFYTATNISNNLIPKKWRQKYNSLTFLRIVMVITSAITVLIAMFVPSFTTFILAIVPLIGITAIPLLLGSFVDTRGYDTGMALSLAIGVVVFAYLFMYPPVSYIWNILPVVATFLFFCAFLAISKKAR